MASEPHLPTTTRHPAAMATGPTGTLVFLCGADMNPLAIANHPGLERARFVAIARMEGSEAGRAGLPPVAGTGEIWGIVLSAPPPEGAAPFTVPVVLRDGTATRAILITGPDTAGAAADILAEAQYWELPVAYRQRLEASLSR